MMNSGKMILAILIMTMAALAISQEAALCAYKTPPPEITRIIDAPAPPRGIVSPNGSYMLLPEDRLYPSITLLGKPRVALAGTEINPVKFTEFRTTETTGLSLLNVETGALSKLELPPGINVDSISWSFDSSHFAFTGEGEKGLELWIGCAKDRSVKRIPGLRLTNILNIPFSWQKDNKSLLAHLVPQDPGAPPAKPETPEGPVGEETSGKLAKVKTYQNLLKSSFDEKLFSFYGQSQLAVVNMETGEVTKIGSPGMYTDAKISPDDNFILVTRLVAPFSYKVPCYLFAQRVELWDRAGHLKNLFAELPAQEEVPPDGVPTGPRRIIWQPLHPSRLLWVEALDGGDPLRSGVPFRDRIMSLDAPFTAPPHETLKLPNRFNGLSFLPQKDLVILEEFSREKQWLTTYLVDLSQPEKKRSILFDRNIGDDYKDPGWPVMQVYDNERKLVAKDGDWIYLAGKGATPEGEKPFLNRFNLNSGKAETLFRSAPETYERFISFFHGKRDQIIVRHESAGDPPNYYLLDLKNDKRYALTSYADPSPTLRSITKELVTYKRDDGVQLSGTLYLPAGYKKGERLPLMIWAYPLEYSDAAVAGQVRGSQHRFTFPYGASPLFFLTQGYAVLCDAAMPVVGDPETKNDTFIEQIVASAKAAIDYLDQRGLINRTQVLVGGHSYGAFMTANLLAHSRLFAAGIARSGAYNRTLTPFGFQSERRSFWEAPAIYVKVSPFSYADKIKDPILIIHGQSDDNPGTFTLQSERLYAAINGNGGTARLVLLPLESHLYVARETILHIIAEMLEWGERFVKKRNHDGSSLFHVKTKT